MIEKSTNNTANSRFEDDITQYLSDIRTIPMLTADEEKKLAKLCASGDENAIRQMVQANLRLVVHIAREYSGRGVALLDLIQEGSIGLLAAARKYDYTLDYRFSTYATKWIRQGVTRCLINNSGIIRIPLHTAERIRRVQTVKNDLYKELNTEPTIEMVAEKAGIPADKVVELLQLSPDVLSLDNPSGDDEKTTMADFIENIEVIQPQETLVRQELERIMQQMLNSLTKRQQMILKYHFGLEDGHSYSLDEIAKMLGISKERVRQIEHQAMDKLQALGTSMGLEDFLNE